MHLQRISSNQPPGQMETALKNRDVLALHPGKIQSREEIELAQTLAKKSFKQKTNIATQFRFEFLLWLSGTRDIQKALKEFGAKDLGDTLLVSWKNPKRLLQKLNSKQKKLNLKREADWQALERIALSRIF